MLDRVTKINGKGNLSFSSWREKKGDTTESRLNTTFIRADKERGK